MRAATLVLLPVALVLVAVESAGADPASGVVAERGSFGVAGPVGVVAVVLGVGGLVIGLLRRKRIVAARAALIETRPIAKVPATRTETAA